MEILTLCAALWSSAYFQPGKPGNMYSLLPKTKPLIIRLIYKADGNLDKYTVLNVYSGEGRIPVTSPAFLLSTSTFMLLLDYQFVLQ